MCRSPVRFSQRTKKIRRDIWCYIKNKNHFSLLFTDTKLWIYWEAKYWLNPSKLELTNQIKSQELLESSETLTFHQQTFQEELSVIKAGRQKQWHEETDNNKIIWQRDEKKKEKQELRKAISITNSVVAARQNPTNVSFVSFVSVFVSWLSLHLTDPNMSSSCAGLTHFSLMWLQLSAAGVTTQFSLFSSLIRVQFGICLFFYSFIIKKNK